MFAAKIPLVIAVCLVCCVILFDLLSLGTCLFGLGLCLFVILT